MLESAPEVERDNAIGYIGETEIIYSGDAVRLLPAGHRPDAYPQRLLDALLRREAVTLGVTATEIMVAFRGTLPADFTLSDYGASGADWLNDARVELVGVQGHPYRVHRGFWHALITMWGRVAAAIRDLRAAHPNLPLCFTGHSKGGAMAQLAAVAFERGPERDATVFVCTFAAARSGDQVMVDTFNANVADSRRYEYGADVVPHLPPHSGDVAGLLGMSAAEIDFLRGYESAGDVYYLPKLTAAAGGASYEVAPAAATQRPEKDQMAANLEAKLAIAACRAAQPFNLNLRGRWIADNHSIAPNSGYDRWIYR